MSKTQIQILILHKKIILSRVKNNICKAVSFWIGLYGAVPDGNKSNVKDVGTNNFTDVLRLSAAIYLNHRHSLHFCRAARLRVGPQCIGTD